MRAMRATGLLAVAGALAITGCGEEAARIADVEEEVVVPAPLEWSAIQRLPVAETLTSVAAVGDVRIAVGTGGAVVVQVGNGPWVPSERITGESLASVVMLDEKTAA